jgi:hypothetical protein
MNVTSLIPICKWRHNLRDHFEFFNEYGSRETWSALIRPEISCSATTSFQMRHSQSITFPIALSKRWKSSCLSIKLSMFPSEFWWQNHSIVFVYFYCVYLRLLKPWNLMKRFRYSVIEVRYVGVTFNVATFTRLSISAAYRISSPGRPACGTTSLRNSAPLPQVPSKGYHIGAACVASPLYITNKYMLFGRSESREWVHQLQWPEAGRHRSRVSRKCIVGTPARGQGSNAEGVASLELVRVPRWHWWWTVLLRHIDGCTPDRVIRLATLFHRGLWGEILMDATGGSAANWACDVPVTAGIGMQIKQFV